ncbi:hypothetical protein [Geomesophilobacter sediminis]|uniref:Uncharacterized protein n=1 Tax=Geomesophilobacter sediminis TaxID=2798584 RepID=A0A8J7IVJ9_9BACT|nr:hypothetical protein [Geomesophilobacter sediminis]MBJ6723182.1 hypothetical protein [Geomesophilobacter sediminis]
MSSILKALEKVERERAARREGLSPVLSSAGKRRSPWTLPVGVAIGAAVAGFVTFAVMGGLSRHKGPAPVAQSAAPERTVAAAPAVKAPSLAATPSAPAEPAPRAAVAPVAASVNKVVTVKKIDLPKAEVVSAAASAVATKPIAAAKTVANKPASKVPPVPVAKRAVTVPAAPVKPAARAAVPVKSVLAKAAPVQPSAKTAPAPTAAPAVSSVAPAPPTPAPAALPEVKVNGIALQSNGDTSFAIVNGRPVSKGGVVDGARVDEILADRVRFSSGGKHFEVKVEDEKQ